MTHRQALLAEIITGKRFPEHIDGRWWCNHRWRMELNIAPENANDMDVSRHGSDSFSNAERE
jgi:hypothetical protein